MVAAVEKDVSIMNGTASMREAGCQRLKVAEWAPTKRQVAALVFVRNVPCCALCRYTHGVLIEVNAHSLFSKWFSESGKLVSRLFAKIQVRLLIKGQPTRCCGGRGIA